MRPIRVVAVEVLTAVHRGLHIITHEHDTRRPQVHREVHCLVAAMAAESQAPRVLGESRLAIPVSIWTSARGR